jgi:hypothetical protein
MLRMSWGATNTAGGSAGTGLTDWAMRFGVFLAALPSGSAVLTEVYGVATLRDVVWFAALPGYLVLIAVWIHGCRASNPRARALADAIALGALGGFLGTIAYDVIRIPFVIAGIRVYVPNSTYGLWILDAAVSTRFTETVGWAYHFANGTCFGIMYAVFMRGRHWAWAIAWAFLLETIALISPYGVVYNLAGKPGVIAIAYLGHVAYGIPLGLMVQHWNSCVDFLRKLPRVVSAGFAALLAAAVIGALTSPSAREADAKVRAGGFSVDEARLVPDYARVLRPAAVALRNPCGGRTVVIVIDGAATSPLAACEERNVTLAPGVHQLFVQTDGFRTRSSFLIVDPVAEARGP